MKIKPSLIDKIYQAWTDGIAASEITILVEGSCVPVINSLARREIQTNSFDIDDSQQTRKNSMFLSIPEGN